MKDGLPQLAEIREALSDPIIASYPDFTAAVRSALDELDQAQDELKRLRSDKDHVAARNDGFEAALEHAQRAAYRVCAETRHVTLGREVSKAIGALSSQPAAQDKTTPLWVFI